MKVTPTRVPGSTTSIAITPSDEIQYDQIVGSPNCLITSSFRDFVEFINFNMWMGQPELKVASH